ncbi:DNA/RNA polymerase [Phlegmacium glaucopus]|nr:DNA/RNA polymerase [Phlegmacium glaucopus]
MSSENPPEGSTDSESLVKRLAGPSSGKAGLAKDQTEINRIISEVSKGSKFYENEKKKDMELTARIEKILKQKEELTRGVDLRKVELVADQLLAQIESHRDLTQIVVHVDMDAFYANVELLDNPKLAGKPFGVGRGVLTTASYEARKYGVRSGMAGFVAKKLCPDLITVPNRFHRYMEMSGKVMDIFHRYDPTMCPTGCDEAYLNISSYCEAHYLTAGECVQQMRDAVFQETKLTVSAGIAPNKMLAKICSDKNKPNGQFQLDFDSKVIKEFMRDLSIRKVPGIGRVNERLLEAIGIKTCGDIYTQRAVISLMDKQFGLMFLLRTYSGVASNVVQAHQRDERKSIGAERTFAPIDQKEKILEKLNEVAAELVKDMEQNGWTGRTVTLKYKLDTYQVFTRAKSFDRWVSTKEELYNTGKEILAPEFPLKIRLIGLRLTKLKDLRDTGPSSNGIKRFFESMKDQSPRKKSKLVHDDPSEFDSVDEINEHLAMEEAMPGFHEDDEADLGMEDDEPEEIIEQDVPISRPVSTAHRPPPFVSDDQASSSKQPPTGPREIHDIDMRKPLSKRETATHNCPVCSKTLETDNEGLNAHIDFCLSRGAIMEAQVEASQSSKSSKTGGKYTGWPKPESKKKFEFKTRPVSKGKPPEKRGK